MCHVTMCVCVLVLLLPSLQLQLDFPLYSSSVNPMAGRCNKLDTSLLGALVHVGGCHIATGDVIFGDEDGVLNLGSDLER